MSQITVAMRKRMLPVYEMRGDRCFLVGYQRKAMSRKKGILRLKDPLEVHPKSKDVMPPKHKFRTVQIEEPVQPVTDDVVVEPENWRELDWRLNVYHCKNGHLTTTVDVDTGVTPFRMGCPHAGCNDDATSSFYPKERPIPEVVPAPSHEWYRPTDTTKLSDGTKDHVDRGGLLLRKRTNAVPVCHVSKEVHTEPEYDEPKDA